jgi:UDP-N-acetylglucosamine transferase subunit ALG13
MLGGRLVIFVTVGSMMPFDRLIRAMDEWARAHPDHDVLAQIGGGSYVPSHMRWTRMLSPSEYRNAVEGSVVIVAHAGMGSFFFAMETGKSIVMLPRYASKNEHTTDHQVHTVQWLRDKPGVHVAMLEDELDGVIDKALVEGSVDLGEFHRFAPEPFLRKIHQFLVQ